MIVYYVWQNALEIVKMKPGNDLFPKLGRLKVYFVGAGFYLSIANFLMLIATSKKIYGVNIPVWVLMLAGFGIVILIGWLDYKLIYRHQVEYGNKMNDLKHQLDRIEKKMK